MSRYYSYLNTAKDVISTYNGEMPLAIYLKQYFASRKQMGSRDRREVASLVYQYYRLGNSLIPVSFEERMAVSIFLCKQEANEMLQLLRQDLNERVSLPLEQKIQLISGFETLKIFPFIDYINPTIDKEGYCLSHLVQPGLFIRIRPTQKQRVINKLTKAGIQFEELTDSCFVIDNKTSLDTLLEMDKEVVIQDYASQQVAIFLEPIKATKDTLNVWDCCAASGGKSILAYDVLGNISLTVTDIRVSILHNLKQRFPRAGINKYREFVGDASKEMKGLGKQLFDLIICDAPCTGSGTWGRVPENLIYFKEETIDDYANIQKSIASGSIKYLAKGGYFLYITCSVFAKENEVVVSFIQLKYPHLQLEKMGIIDGYKKRADNMFAALFYNPV